MILKENQVRELIREEVIKYYREIFEESIKVMGKLKAEDILSQASESQEIQDDIISFLKKIGVKSLRGNWKSGVYALVPKGKTYSGDYLLLKDFHNVERVFFLDNETPGLVKKHLKSSPEDREAYGEDPVSARIKKKKK